MEPTKLKEIVLGALGAEQLDKFARELGAVQRQSKVTMLEFVVALVLAARTSAGGRQAEAMRLFRDHLGGAKVARSSFYERFNRGLEALMEQLLSRALAQAALDPIRLPPAISFVSDWEIQDSTTVKLDDRMMQLYAGTGDYAQLKVHKRYSIGRGNLVSYSITSGLHHDSQELTLDESWRGKGLLVDLGYASHELLRACRQYGVYVVIRVKDGWRVHVKDAAVGKLKARRGNAPLNLPDALSSRALTAVDGIIDADVALPMPGEDFPIRYVSLAIEGKGTCEFLTNIPRDLASPTTIGDLYRLRWNIELDNKLNKSDWVLDEVDAEKPESVHVLVFASLLGSVLVNRIVHADRLARLAAAEQPRTGPLHTRLVALTLATSAQALAAAVVAADENDPVWQRVARGIDAGGRDPNWRKRPSVLDRLFGFVPPQEAPRQKSIKPPAGDR